MAGNVENILWNVLRSSTGETPSNQGRKVVASHEGHPMALSTRLARAHERVMASTPPGQGGRFAHMKEILKKKGARSPGALAAFIGRRKFGAKRMAQMAAAGR